MQIKVRLEIIGTKRGKWRCDHESPRCGLAMAARLLGLHTGMQTQMGLRLGLEDKGGWGKTMHRTAFWALGGVQL